MNQCDFFFFSAVFFFSFRNFFNDIPGSLGAAFIFQIETDIPDFVSL